MNKYDPKKIETKWQKFWEKNKTFEVTEDPKKKKFYSLIEFPYPSGEGLHVGHPRPFTAMDVVSRKKRMEGFNVLYPIGFDAFGLPTENFAIKTKQQPADVTKKNIANFTRQLKSLGYSFDWSRAVDTTDPKYFKWTQWIFLQFYKHGLAYKKNQPINWCPKDKIGLANEEVVQGCCERCGTPVEQRNKEQWMLGITKYAESLLEGLKEVGYITPARVQQENWIGKSEGAEITFELRVRNSPLARFAGAPARREGGEGDVRHTVTVFTTRPDTIFGATFLAVSPELAHKWLSIGWQASDAVKKYVAATLEERKATVDREEKEKTGIDAGIKAVNPATGEEIPVWITNYVLGNVGTGAIMAVPAHDERDFEFAKKFNLPIRQVVSPLTPPYEGGAAAAVGGGRYEGGAGVVAAAFTDNGIAINSDFLNGLKTSEAKEKMITWLEEKGIGKRQVNYKLRDWVFSRQRYWGEPIPLVHCENCKNKKQKVLLIHGFTGTAEKNWFPWMKKELEARGFEVFAPTMSTTNHPVLAKWIEELMPFVEQMGEDDIVVGHSIGGKAALHLLERTKKKIGHLYLVAPALGSVDEAFWLKKKNRKPEKDYEIVREFEGAKLDWKKVAANVESANVLFSQDDESVITYRHEVFPTNWQVQELNGFDHFCDPIIPELLDKVLQSKNTGWIPLPESELPLELPKVKNYEPTDTGESPLAAMETWVKTKCPKCGGPARRETDTMPNWAGSSWYFLRYCDPSNEKEFGSMEKLKYWMDGQPVILSEAKDPLNQTERDSSATPVGAQNDRTTSGGVDWYNGGMEHTVLHLLYSRFWNQFLYDIGVVPTKEPYKKRTSHGMILGPDGEKMSKSRGNVINPDDMIEQFGTDAFRGYIMFMGPFDQAVMWDTNGLVGVRRFLDRVWNLQEKVASGEESRIKNQESRIVTLLHQTIKKVTNDIDKMSFNTAIAALMQLTNEMTKEEKISPIAYRLLIQLLSPFAPHLTEELWEKYGDGTALAFASWPSYDEALTKESSVTIALQVNGKVRDTIEVAADISEDDIKKLALENSSVQRWLEGKEPKKVIYVKGKLVSVVV